MEETREPEPIYKARIRSILVPLHPLFTFNITQMDIHTTIDFDISLQANPNKGILPGTFAGFWFNRLQANNHNYSISEQIKHFEQYVFKCLARFISEVLNRKSLGSREKSVLYDGLLNVRAIERYIANLASGFDIFTTYSGQKNGRLHLILDAGKHKNTQTGRPITPINAGGFNLQDLEQQLLAFSTEYGLEQANKRLKQYLLNLFTDALYNARLDLNHD